jgi:hypothetical protein
MRVQNFKAFCLAPPHPDRSAELTVEALSRKRGEGVSRRALAKIAARNGRRELR